MDSILPKITVITPSFNQGRFIEQTILSVLNQNYPNLEYMILDGGSTDETVSIIRKYEKQIAFWRSTPDGGQAEAIRDGFLRASGEIVAYLNSDDVYFPGIFHKVADAYRQSMSASIFTGYLAHCDELGRVSKICIPTRLPKWFYEQGIIGFWQPSSFFNLSEYRAVGGVKSGLRFRMDADLIHRMLERNPEVVLIDQPAAFFRIHDASKSTAQLDIHKNEMDVFLKERNISQIAFEFAKSCYRMHKVFSRRYLQSVFLTHQYAGKSIASVWDTRALN